MVQPGGFEGVFRALATATTASQPADTSVSYAESLQVSTYLDGLLGGFGVRYLSRAEIAEQMPDFPIQSLLSSLRQAGRRIAQT